MESNKLIVKIDQDTVTKIRWLTDNMTIEVSAWLLGEIDNGEIKIDGMLIPEQESSGTSVDVSAEANTRLRKQYGKQCEKIIGQWHSHPDMDAFWSSTDEEDIENTMKTKDLFFFMVTGKDGAVLSRIDLNGPIKATIHDINLKIQIEKEEEIIKQLKKEVKEKVKESVIVSYTPGTDWKDTDWTRTRAKIVIEKDEVEVKSLKYSEYRDLIQLIGQTPLSIINEVGEYTITYKTKNKKQSEKLRKQIQQIIYFMQDEVIKTGGDEYEYNPREQTVYY